MFLDMPNKVFVVGVGMTKFEKPGRREGWDYPQMAKESGTKALEDAGIDYTEVQQGYVGYVAGDSTSGQRALYELGMTGIPIVNVNNNCSTGSTALYLAAQAIRGGLADCVLALGSRRCSPARWAAAPTTASRRWATRRRSPRSTSWRSRWRRGCSAPPAASTWRSTARTAEHFAKIGYKNHKHSVNNPYAQFQDEYTLDDILGAQDDLRPADQTAVLPHLRRLGRGDPGQ